MRDILAIDVGTTGFKMGVFAPDLTKKTEASRRYDVNIYDQGKADIEPEKWWRALQECCVELKESLEFAELNAELRAPQDGKNAEARKRQVKDYVAGDMEVKRIKALIVERESARSTIEAEKARHNAHKHFLSRRFTAYCEAARLLAAQMNLESNQKEEGAK